MKLARSINNKIIIIYIQNKKNNNFNYEELINYFLNVYISQVQFKNGRREVESL